MAGILQKSQQKTADDACCKQDSCLFSPSLLHSPPPFPLLNNEDWLVLIVLQAMNFFASFQVARAYSVRDLNLGGTFRLDAPNTENFVLSGEFLIGMCRFGYGAMRDCL